ncbi:glycosyltransferase [Teredinibacter waterburyi]|uniref:glycosyltransferase n=1 Tax=Teredinibacter waterburyi TaxID=1500538 RepID=UPI00165FB77A|nr:glycosyltransferase [Teredinibacter waterburyi]
MARILVVVPDFYPAISGYANASVNALYAYCSLDHEVHLLSYKAAELPEGLNCHLHIVDIDDTANLDENIAASLAGKWDGVIFETFESSDIHLRLVKLIDVNIDNVTVRIHGCTETEVFTSGELAYPRDMFAAARELSAKLRQVWSTTRYYIDYHRTRYFNHDLERARISYHQLPNFPPGDHYAEARHLRKHRRESNASVVFLGRLSSQGVHQKNVYNFLGALYHLKVNQLLPEGFVAYLVGDGNEAERVLARIDTLGLASVIAYRPSLEHSETLKLLAEVRGACLLSKYEGHSMFALECFYTGVPILLSEKVGAAEHRNLASSLLVDPDDIFAIADQMLRLLELGRVVRADTTEQTDGYLSNYSFDVLRQRANTLIDLLCA